MFFGALPRTRRRVSLIFVFLCRLFCPLCAIHERARGTLLWFASRPRFRVFPPGCCPVWLASHPLLHVCSPGCCLVCVRARLWLVSRRLLRVSLCGIILWLASHPLLRVCSLPRGCSVCFLWRVPLSFSIVFCWCTPCCYFLHFVHLLDYPSR